MPTARSLTNFFFIYFAEVGITTSYNETPQYQTLYRPNRQVGTNFCLYRPKSSASSTDFCQTSLVYTQKAAVAYLEFLYQHLNPEDTLPSGESA